jgi:hypothetical protein
MQITSIILQLLTVAALGISLAWIKGLTDLLIKYIKQDRPHCNFIPNYKNPKVETRNTIKPRENGKEEHSNRQAFKGSSFVEAPKSSRL